MLEKCRRGDYNAFSPGSSRKRKKTFGDSNDDAVNSTTDGDDQYESTVYNAIVQRFNSKLLMLSGQLEEGRGFFVSQYEMIGSAQRAIQRGE